MTRPIAHLRQIIWEKIWRLSLIAQSRRIKFSSHTFRMGTRAIVNGLRFLTSTSLKGWRRNLTLNAPAAGSMTLLLILTGVAGTLGFALWTTGSSQAKQAMLIHVYLQDGLGNYQVSDFSNQILAVPGVTKVTYTSKAQALVNAKKRPGMQEIVSATGSNPFPASLDVQASSLVALQTVDHMARGDQRVDPILPTSYNPQAYLRLQQALYLLLSIGVGFLLVTGIVALAVTSNSIRAAIIARSNEVEIMQLVGAPPWMVRGPFVLEGTLTGLFSGFLAALTIMVSGLLLVSSARSFFQLPAPGVDEHLILMVAGITVILGAGLGMMAASFGIRRYIRT